jgi:hypothetical protein
MLYRQTSASPHNSLCIQSASPAVEFQRTKKLVSSIAKPYTLAESSSIKPMLFRTGFGAPSLHPQD